MVFAVKLLNEIAEYNSNSVGASNKKKNKFLKRTVAFR